MKVDIFVIDEFVKANNCPQITSPVFFNFDKSPHANGLFSYDLFGFSDEERRNIFGYVDLGGRYLHPLVYALLTSRMGSLKNIVNGTLYAIVVGGRVKVVEADVDGAQTGIDFFYDNFNEIKWFNIDDGDDEISSVDKKTRLKFLNSLKKDEFFITKWLVLPPFYRSENSEEKTMGDSINSLYKELIMRSNTMKGSGKYDLFGNATINKIQSILYALFIETSKIVKGKHSLLRMHLMGKSVDYLASNVITAPNISSSFSPKTMPCPFGTSSYPLATVTTLFKPFFVSECTRYLEERAREANIELRKEDLEINISEVNSENTEKLIDLFIKSPADRFNKILLPVKHKKNAPKDEVRIRINKRYSKTGKVYTEPLTLTDLIFIQATAVIKDKHVYATRYPVLNYQNIYPSKIKLMSTSKVVPEVWISDMFDANGENEESSFVKYDNYPIIYKEDGENKFPKSHYEFVDVAVPGNVYMAAVGGDYDGDMMYFKGVFSKEANDEAERLIKDKKNLLGADGKLTRGISMIGKDSAIALYTLTK